MIETTLLHLSLIPTVGPATIDKLVQFLTLEQLDSIYSFKYADFKTSYALSEQTALALVSGLADKALLNKELELIDKHAINWATLISDSYPLILKAIYLPPTILYWQGNISASNQKAIAFVGSRQCNRYGHDVINRLVPDLVQDNWTIVSGGALGIDTLSHSAALNNKGITYAVLGSGLLKPYPATNKQLFDKIIASQGAVISSFSLLQSPLPGNFPSRNRIVAGLSKACVVVQAAEKSGALITAHYALEQGKEVGAVPGPINDPLSKGCHGLISQGATLVQAATDITNALGYRSTTPELVSKNVARNSGKNDAAPVNNREIEIKQTSFLENMSLEEKIYILCREPISFDELSSKLNCERAELQTLLFNLQIEERIHQNFMGLWHQ